MSDSPFIFDVTVENFAEVVLQGSMERPVLVDFWADWCNPCKMLMPILSKLADEYAGQFILAKVNSDEQQALAQQFGVRSLPTVKLFSQGQPVDEFMGAIPEGQIRDFIGKHLVRPSDQYLANAAILLEQGNPTEAIQHLAEAIKVDPQRPEPRIELAKVYVEMGHNDEAEEVLKTLSKEDQDREEVVALLSRIQFTKEAGDLPDEASLLASIETDENDLEARYQLATLKMAQNDYETAMEQLLTIMQKDRTFKDDVGRTTLLKIFDMLGQDQRVKRYRSKMFALLH